MKKTFFTITLLCILMVTSACGSLRNNCKLEGQTCDTLFGKNTMEQEERIDNLEKTVSQLEQDLQNVYIQSQYNEQQYLLLEQYIQQYENNSSQFQTLLNNQNLLLTNQQQQINNILTQLTPLNGYKNITSLYDACGDKPGKIDEVFIVLSSGEMLSSFSDNGNALTTRFALLSPGNYETTDTTSCKFTVVADPQPGKPNKVKITNEHY